MVTENGNPGEFQGWGLTWHRFGPPRRIPRPHYSPGQGRSTERRLRPPDLLSPQIDGELSHSGGADWGATWWISRAAVGWYDPLSTWLPI